MSLSITIDDDELVRAVREAEDGIGDLVHEVAEQLVQDVQAEGAGVHAKLAHGWTIDDRGEFDAAVVAPPEAWWAHFVAGGTRSHGRSGGGRMVFNVDGQTVSAVFVSGVTANPFDERAVKRTESKIDEILGRLID
jgi:hypothetical protein